MVLSPDKVWEQSRGGASERENNGQRKGERTKMEENIRTRIIRGYVLVSSAVIQIQH